LYTHHKLPEMYLQFGVSIIIWHYLILIMFIANSRWGFLFGS